MIIDEIIVNGDLVETNQRHILGPVVTIDNQEDKA